MPNCLARPQLELAVAVAALTATAAQAVELNPAAVVFKTPDQLVGRPDRQARHQPDRSRGDPEKPGRLYLHQQVQA